MLGLTGLLAIVALASRGSHPGGGGALRHREIPVRVADDLLTIAIIVFVLGVVVLIGTFLAVRDEWYPVRRRWWRDLLVFSAVMLLLALVAYRVGIDPKRFSFRTKPAATATTSQNSGASGTPTLRPRPAAPKPAHFDWQLAAALSGLALVALAIYIVRTRRSESPGGADEHVEEELTAALSDAIDDLRREPDARRAVIAAYARMERVLAAHGFGRKPAEAPFEYLGRILRALRVRESAVRALTELFERAKFSSHEIDEGMRGEAVSALEAVREDLRPVDPGVAA